MIGTIVNVAGILVGGIAGLTSSRPLSPANQSVIKVGLGAFIVYFGLNLTWQAVGGGFLSVCRQLLIVVLALILGKMTGRLLRLQKSANRLGHFANERFIRSQQQTARKLGEGFVVCTVLYCVSPMAFLGSVEEGLTGNFRILSAKAVMDGLATMAFATTFGWGVLLSALPVAACQGTLTLCARLAAPWLENHHLLEPVNATAGLLVFCIALIALGLKKIELADYLPSLGFAPLLAALARW